MTAGDDHLRRIASAVERIADRLEDSRSLVEVIGDETDAIQEPTASGPRSPIDALAEALPDALHAADDLPESSPPERVFRVVAEALFPTVRMLLEDEITSRYHPEFGTEYQEQEVPGGEEAAARPDQDRKSQNPPDDMTVDMSVLRRVDEYTIEMFGHRVRATPDQEARLREMTPEQALRFIGIMGGGKKP